MRELVNRSKEQWALLQNGTQANSKLAIFVHGFRGSYLATWGRLPGMLAREADADPTFAACDYLFVGYDTRNVATYLDISSLICSQWDLARQGHGPFGRAYTDLSLFGHSLGTLGIRQMLCAWSEQPAHLLQAVRKVTFFGTPLNGSPLAPFAIGYEIKDALRPKSPQLRMLRTWVKSAHGVRPWPPIRLVLGQDDRVVGHKFAELIDWPGDATPPAMTTLGHTDLVKPNNWQTSAAMPYIKQGLP